MAREKPLLERTKALLERLHGERLTYQEIADGSDVDREWLAKLARGEIPEPGVNKVQRVHDFLSRVSPA